MTSLRLLSVDARGFGRDHAALARAIADARPDVVCVHGGPHLLRWRSISAALARRAGLVVVTGGRTAGANLLLSTLGVDVTAIRDMRLGRGGAALAALQLHGTEFVLASVTLTGNGTARLARTRELRRAISTLVPGHPPAIISADGSVRSGDALWGSLVENRVAPAERLLVDGRLTVTGVVQEERAVRVDLSIGAE